VTLREFLRHSFSAAVSMTSSLAVSLLSVDDLAFISAVGVNNSCLTEAVL